MSSIPASKVYTEEGILQITPASTNPKFTDEGAWNTFRTCGRDDQQGEVAGHTVATEFKDRKVAILHDNTTYGKGIADETKKYMNAAGKKEDMYQVYVPGEHDYTALVSRLKEAGINLVYFGGYHSEVGLIVRQAKEQGLKATFLGPDLLVTRELWQISGPAGEGLMMTFPADPRMRPSAAEVVKEFKAKNIDPEGYVLYTYAAIEPGPRRWRRRKRRDGRNHQSDERHRVRHGDRQASDRRRRRPEPAAGDAPHRCRRAPTSRSTSGWPAPAGSFRKASFRMGQSLASRSLLRRLHVLLESHEVRKRHAEGAHRSLSPNCI